LRPPPSCRPGISSWGMDTPPTVSQPDDRARELLERAAELERHCKYAEAEALLRENLERERGREPQEPDLLALACSRLAQLQHYQGKYAQAEGLEREALVIRRSRHGEEGLDTARGYSNLAIHLRFQGRYAEAEVLLRKSLSILASSLDDADPDGARCSSNLALVLEEQSRYAEAEPLLRSALAARTSVFGGSNLETARSRIRLASCVEAQGRVREAEPLLRAALSDYVATVGPAHEASAFALFCLAKNLHRQGRSGEAEPLIREAVSIASKVLVANHPKLAMGLRFFGEIRAAQGDLLGAEGAFRQALAACSSRVGEEHAETAPCAFSLGLCLHAQQRFADAESELRASACAYEAVRTNVSFDGLDRVPFASERSPLTFLAACLARNGKPREAWECLERNFARGLLDALSGDLVRAGGQDVSGIGRVLDIASIQSWLPRDAAVLAWVDCTAPPGSSDPSGEHWAFLLRAGMPPACVPLQGSGSSGAWTKEDDELPERLRWMLSRPPAAASELDALQLAANRLRLQRVAPIEHLLKARGALPAVRTVFVIPAGVMAGVPIEVFLPDVSISYVPSATLLARGLERAVKPGPVDRSPNLLAVGEPSFAVSLGGGVAPDDASSSSPELPASRKEVEVISEFFDPASREVLCGSDASEARLDELNKSGRLPQFTHVHFATHAVIEPERPLQSALLLAEDSRLEPLESVLAGRAPCDGRLTAAQVLRGWHLDAELVVLSACETALGKPAGGEGFLGFVQAFFIAGARSIVVSLWKVDDRATALLMARFYENVMVRKASKAEALADAKQWLRELPREAVQALLRGVPEARCLRGVRNEDLESGASPAGEHPYLHPYYWAGFVLFDLDPPTGR